MSQDPVRTVSELRSLTVDQVNSYLERKDCERPCEACGCKEWNIDIWNGDIVYVSTPVVPSNEKGASLVYLPLTCAFCGNTRFINAGAMSAEILGYSDSDG